MNCCVNCFEDNSIRSTIESLNQIGDCDFCGSESLKVYPIGEKGDIEQQIDSVLDLYELTPDTPGNSNLEVCLLTDWNIFGECYSNKKYEDGDFVRLIKALCSQFRSEEEIQELFTNGVRIPICEDSERLYDYGIVRGLSWSKFSDEIKYKNRFHSDSFNADVFSTFLESLEKVYAINSIAYRARIAENESGFTADKMKIPPRGKRSAGRINPEEMPVLYLALEKDTAMNEVRASVYDFVSIGSMKAIRDLKIVDLSRLSKIDAFSYQDLEQYIINHTCLTEIAEEISKPLRRTDKPIEYLPTQYIAEFIKQCGYDGVEYESTMLIGGHNLAIFDESLFECLDVSTVEVSKVIYETQ
jgi:hypothetical protein